jgi:ribonuclease J
MMKNVEIAEEQGLIKVGYGTKIEIGDSRACRDDEICYIITGSQGENRAALWNMATSTYKGMEIEKGDTVVLSARIIPGNEKNISRLIGHLIQTRREISLKKSGGLFTFRDTRRRKTSRSWSKRRGRNISSRYMASTECFSS